MGPVMPNRWENLFRALLFTSICFLLLAICITYSFADTLDFTKRYFAN